MTSDGGLVDVSNFSGLKSILSGPAGGVVGFAETSWDENEKIPIIGLDMVNSKHSHATLSLHSNIELLCRVEHRQMYLDLKVDMRQYLKLQLLE